MNRGDVVKTLVQKSPYYSGYGGRPTVTIPMGFIGTVGAVDVAAVYRTPGRPARFLCVDFMVDGVQWRGNYYPDEIEIYNPNFKQAPHLFDEMVSVLNTEAWNKFKGGSSHGNSKP